MLSVAKGEISPLRPPWDFPRCPRTTPTAPKSPSLRCNPQRPFASNKTGASNVILRSDGVAGSLHVPARGFRYMAGSSRRSLFLIVFVLATFGLLGMLFAQRISPATAPSSDSDVRDSLKQFTEVYETIEQNYADPVNADKAIYNCAIPSMLHQLDPHSNFFDPKSYSPLRADQRGKYYGVGMTVGPRNNKVIVIAPFVGTPAYRAGIRPGDIIAAVDGKPTDNMETGDVAGLLNGAKGTTVRITMLRGGPDKPLTFAHV